MHIMKLIFDGDSWAFGSEIVDSSVFLRNSNIVEPEEGIDFRVNDRYRVPKIYSHHMAQQLGCDYVNLGCPSDDNSSIIQRTMSYITTEYIRHDKSTDDILVIIGWTIPERNNFWWKNSKISQKIRLQPQSLGKRLLSHPNNCSDQDDQQIEEFSRMYAVYMWNPEEYIPRYISTIVQFQNFCNAHNIKWLSYNTFYQTPVLKRLDRNPSGWQDLDVLAEVKKIDKKIGSYHASENGKRKMKDLNIESLWHTVDPVRFYKKDQPVNTFKSFIDANVDDPYVGQHPSPSGHEAWATELVRYIKENNLL